MGEHPRPIGAESIEGIASPPTTFPAALAELEKAIPIAEKRPTEYEPALDVCLATRAAWTTCHDDWLFFGRLPDAEIERFKAVLARAEQVVAATAVADAKDRELLPEYARNIRTRAELLELLAASGPEAVHRRIDELRAERAAAGQTSRPTVRVPRP